MNKGSEWRKWNFHVHTKGTNKNDQFQSLSPDDFFLTFYRKAIENNISAIGITDYFSIDRYYEARDYRDTINEKIDANGKKHFEPAEIDFIKNIFLFPNVELRMMPSTGSAKLINIHCLFNPEYTQELENDFFSHIENQAGVKMNKRGITNYGKSLDSKITDSTKQYEKGIDNFVIDIKSLKELIETKRAFRDNTILVVSNSNKDGASGLQGHYELFENNPGSLDGVRKSIYEIADAIFSTNQKDIKYFLGRKSQGMAGYSESIYKTEVEEVIRERRSLKPCITGCDAHTETQLFDRFTWIKGDLSFEGLRQICFEPEQRVKIQTAPPDYKEEKLLIDHVRFISPNKIFSEKLIYLNSNLNVIIGGKSSGKSILLYAIAKTLTADTSMLKNDDQSYKYELGEIEPQFDFEIITKGNFKQRMGRSKTENSILPEIKYIPQNYLVKLAEPELNKKGKSLNKLVRDLITEDAESKDSYDSFLSKVIQNDRIRNAQIDHFFEMCNKVAELEEELKTKSNKSVLEKNILTNTEKVEQLNKSTGLTDDQIQEYKSLQEKLETSNEKIQQFRSDYNLTESFNKEFVQAMKNIKQKKDALIESLQLHEIKEYYQNAYAPIDTIYEQSMEIGTSLQTETKTDGKRTFTSESKFKDVLISLNADKNSFNESIQPYLKDEQTKKIIEELNQSIANDKKSLTDIVNLTKKIQDQKRLSDESKSEIFRIYEASFEEYNLIIQALKNRTIELEKDGLGMVGKVQFNFPKLTTELKDISDGRTASYNNYSILSDNKKATDETEFSIILRDVKKLFDDVISKKYALTNKTSIQNASKIILNDYFFDFWEITYKNDKLGAMSTGKASFVILMLIVGLSTSKAPILIDQPEDNLDNRSITTDLVNYLKNKKLERQIIVVTHNANVVVNADAENIIVANQKGQNDDSSSGEYQFDYINGAIENSFDKISSETDILKSMGIRQHVAEIVEGGKEAFIMREKKYRFS